MRRALPLICLASIVGSLLAALTRARGQAARLAGDRDALTAERKRLRHDMRGHLSPILMASERLADHTDPKVARLAAMMSDRVARAIEDLG